MKAPKDGPVGPSLFDQLPTATTVRPAQGATSLLKPCPHCAVPVIHALEDRGFLMYVEPMPDGPYVIHGESVVRSLPLLRLVSTANEAMMFGTRVIRKLEPGETRYGSHIVSCAQRDRWGVGCVARF